MSIFIQPEISQSLERTKSVYLLKERNQSISRKNENEARRSPLYQNDHGSTLRVELRRNTGEFFLRKSFIRK